MAVTRGKSPVVMTAVNDVLNSTSDIPRVWKVIGIRVVNGSNAGEFNITDNQGNTVFANSTLAANAVDQTTWGSWRELDDLKLVTWPTGARAYVDYR